MTTQFFDTYEQLVSTRVRERASAGRTAAS